MAWSVTPWVRAPARRPVGRLSRGQSLSRKESFLLFRAAGLGFAIEARSVTGIAPLQELIHVSDLPTVFRGLTRLHRQARPVLDLARRFTLEPELPAPKQSLLLEVVFAESPQMSVALMADAVMGVESLRRDEFRPPDAHLPANSTLGWVRLRGRIYHLLDITVLIPPEDAARIEPLLH
jgi:chemotaxis signal transduction protein